MADEPTLAVSVQESILTCIAFGSDDNSTFVSTTIDVVYLDQPLSDIAAKCIAFRRKYKQPPGMQHIDDVFADILENTDSKQRSSYQRILNAMIRLEKNLNTKFIADLVHDFNRRRAQRLAIHKAAQVYQDDKSDNTTDMIDEIFRAALRDGSMLQRNRGFTLREPEALGFLDRSVNTFCPIGIEQFDNVGLHPAKKEMLLFIAARNKGKSQFLHHCGKLAAHKGWKVVHYTLENSAEMSAMRYFQSFYSGVKRPGNFPVTRFESISNNKTDLVASEFKPLFTVYPGDLGDNKNPTHDFLAYKQEKDYKLNNIRVKHYPTGMLSFDQFQRDLDEMDLIDHFTPDLVMIDYPQMMKLRRGENDWTHLEELAIQLRGSAIERNYALVVPQQGNRASESAQTVYGHHGGGSIGMLAVADNAITYSQTPAEEKHGVARLYAQKVRNDQARFTILITQHYPSGQFCLDSRFMSDDLRKKVEEFTGFQGDNIEAEDEEEPVDDRRRIAKARG